MLIDESPEMAIKEHEMSKEIAESLHKHYAGHVWAVKVDLRGGVIQVFNFRFSGRWGFVLKIVDVIADPKKVIMAGGELLERYRVSRGAFREDERETLATDMQGNYLADTL